MTAATEHRDRTRELLSRATKGPIRKRAFWSQLRSRQVEGVEVQAAGFSIAGHVSRFCRRMSARLVIEVDGGQHADDPRLRRSEFVLRLKRPTIRVRSTLEPRNVLANTEGVLEDTPDSRFAPIAKAYALSIEGEGWVRVADDRGTSDPSSRAHARSNLTPTLSPMGRGSHAALRSWLTNCSNR